MCLRILGETIEEDIFLLEETETTHKCLAFTCCFPTGFDPSSKLGLGLQGIHGPVPAYEKIGPSMERFFRKLEVGKSVKRMNVSSSILTRVYFVFLSERRSTNSIGAYSGISKLVII
jgi:hypothetical protein